jgi:NAD(P)-dependent dehydrogenase (short-subunit alcohol dehydrogenase family)
MKNLQGKVAVITGAGSGIGRALAQAFAAEGCHMALVDINEAWFARNGGFASRKKCAREYACGERCRS